MDFQVADFAAINKQLGLSEDEITLSDKAIISDKELETMQGIARAGNTPPLDFSRQEGATTDETPEFLKPYKDILASPFQKAEDPNTDYSARSIKEFGQEFSHLRTRDQFADEVLSRKSYNEFISQQPVYKEVEDILEGRIDSKQLVRDRIKDILVKNLTYTDELYDQKISEYFDASGNLNERGKIIQGEVLTPYKNSRRARR